MFLLKMHLFHLTASLFALAQKVQSIHWTIHSGAYVCPFISLHTLLGDQYKRLREFGDKFGEHMVILDLSPPTLHDIAHAAIPPFVEDDWIVMIGNISADYTALALAVNEMKSDNRSINNDLDELHNFLSKQQWFLRSYLPIEM